MAGIGSWSADPVDVSFCLPLVFCFSDESYKIIVLSSPVLVDLRRAYLVNRNQKNGYKQKEIRHREAHTP